MLTARPEDLHSFLREREIPMDEQINQQANGRNVWFRNRRVQRIVGVSDVILALLLLVSGLALQFAGYEPMGPFGVGPFWVVPAAMIVLGIMLLRGVGVSPR